jgi:hypothetical protein
MFNNKKNIIKYGKVNKALPGLGNLKTKVPQWYKDGNRFVPGERPFNNQAMKLCMPFLDALTSGYCVELMTDLVVERHGDTVELIWPENSFQIVQKREAGTNPTVPVPIGCDPEHYIWRLQVALELPKGYSAIFTHPMNRYDLPFISMSGIVDADTAIGTGNLPFFLKSNFEGIIPAGTPIIQIIPFKRENWQSQEDYRVFQIGEANAIQSKSKLYGWYKQNSWNKKTFD